MEKTGIDIENDIYQLLKASPIAEAINGGIYRDGQRPRDSRQEDAVVRFTEGFGGQVQVGTVTIDVYVPDIDPYGNGITTIDGNRCTAIASIAQAWVESLSAATIPGYMFPRRERMSIRTEQDLQSLSQHFVAIKLKYQYVNND
jgi:hypothetical protein